MTDASVRKEGFDFRFNPGESCISSDKQLLYKISFFIEPFFLKISLPPPDKYGIEPEYFFINFFVKEIRYALPGLRF